MKRYLTIVLLMTLVVCLCGCDMWMDGSYSSVTPHREDHVGQNQETVEVSNYFQLENALAELVSDGSQNGVIYIANIDQRDLEQFMDRAVAYVTEEDPVGTYAINEVQYEIGTHTGRTAIAVSVSYNHTRSEILRIKHTDGMDAAKGEILSALANCDAGVVILVDGYRVTDFVQLVQDFVDANPNVCMEMPQVAATLYPETGLERVIELSFTYQTSRDTLRQMQNYVSPVFRAANLNVSGEEDESTKYSLMYAFLMERNDYRLETSITPPYSLLRHGVGDSRAFAVVYAAMCREAGLDCQTVTGTRDGEPWVWNIICQDGVYYYVDLLRSEAVGRLQLLTDYDMKNYVWDYTAYPETGPAYQPEVPEAGTVDPTEETEPLPEETETTAPSEPEPTVPEETAPEETAPEQ